MQAASGVSSMVMPAGGTVPERLFLERGSHCPNADLSLSPELHLTLLGSYDYCSLNLIREWEREQVTLGSKGGT